jgi:hypothetical protein
MCHLGPDSPFFNIFSRIQLELFTKEEAEGFIKDPFKTMGFEIDRQAIKAILRLTGLHPCFISQLCDDLHFKTLEKRTITKEDIDQLNSEFQASIFDDFNYYLHRLTEDEQAMLSNIAEGNPPKSLEDPLFLKLERLSLVLRDKNKIIPFSIPFGQFLKEVKGTDIYFEKAFSDLEFGNASYILLAENLFKAAKNIPESIREHLAAAIHTMQGRPQESMRTCGRDVLLPIMDKVYKAEFGLYRSGSLYDSCNELEQKAKIKLFPRHLAAHFHSLRTSGNDGSHAEEYVNACTQARAFLTVLETIHVAEEVYKRYQ